MDFSNYEISEKEVYKKLRKEIINKAATGGYSQRIRLLAYGFLRGRVYGALESKTNGDNHCLVGQETYYSQLATSVSIELHKQFSGPDAKLGSRKNLYDAVKSWIEESRNKESQEAA